MAGLLALSAFLGFLAGAACAAFSLVRVWSPQRNKYLERRARLKVIEDLRFEARAYDAKARSAWQPFYMNKYAARAEQLRQQAQDLAYKEESL